MTNKTNKPAKLGTIICSASLYAAIENEITTSRYPCPGLMAGNLSVIFPIGDLCAFYDYLHAQPEYKTDPTYFFDSTANLLLLLLEEQDSLVAAAERKFKRDAAKLARSAQGV